MCLIIHRVSGSNVPNDILDHNRKKNPDGFGLAWRQNGKLHTAKFGPREYQPFHDKLKALDRQSDIEYVAHYRMATHGPACQDLAHPFVYDDPDNGEIAVFHNGIIDIATDRSKESDTSTFVKQVLSKMHPGWWRNPAYRFLVENAIGYSRLLIMTPKETIRLNESAWVKRGGIMYSTEPGGGRPKYNPGVHVSSGKGTERTGTIVKYTPPVQWLEPKTDDTCGYGWEDADDDEAVQTWMHEGHRIESLAEDRIGSKGEDISCEALCVQCGTIGEVYVIEGTTFIDVEHKHVHSVDDEDEDDLDAVTMARVYSN